MSPAELAELFQEITLRCPGRPLPVDAADLWLRDLSQVLVEDAVAAVKRWAAAGNAFPPTPDWVLAQAQRAEQGDPPSFDDMQAYLSRHASSLPHGDVNTPRETAVGIDQLAELGAHEAILRFIAAHGLTAVRLRMPDPGFDSGLDANQLADRRDLARAYRDRVIPDWERDPRPGLALERACRTAELTRAELATLDHPRPHRRLPAGERRALPAPEPDEGPYIDPADVLSIFEKTAAANRIQRKTRDAARRAEQEREDAEVQAAERELAEHARRREQEAATR